MINLINVFVKYFLIILLILKPMGMFIERFLKIYDFTFFTNDNQKLDTNGSGKMVGYLERLTIFMLLIVGQYLVIGFIGAIKTGIRYDQITKL